MPVEREAYNFLRHEVIYANNIFHCLTIDERTGESTSQLNFIKARRSAPHSIMYQPVEGEIYKK